MTPTSPRSFYRQNPPSIPAGRAIHFSNRRANFKQRFEIIRCNNQGVFVPCGMTREALGLKYALFKPEFEKGGRGGMTRPADITRELILKAARSLFAERGYQDTTIRAVVAKARVNQAAINYHFGGKDGLYREVLRAAIRTLTEHQLAHAEEMKGMSRENALVEFVKYQLRPLAARDRISQHYRLFNWETVRPTTVYRDIISEEATPFLGFAVDLMRRFMPNTDQRTLTMAAIWLVGQCAIFVRNREQLANPPVSLDLDEAAVERLTNLVSAWALSGLAHAPLN
jgi:AcrR family transcriptional regulator